MMLKDSILLKGGSWDSVTSSQLSTYHTFGPRSWMEDLGFRIKISIDENYYCNP